MSDQELEQLAANFKAPPRARPVRRYADEKAFADQKSFSDKEREEKRALFIKRLRADPDLTLGQIHERFGIGSTQAKAWAAEEGLPIGKAEVMGSHGTGVLAAAIRRRRKAGAP